MSTLKSLTSQTQNDSNHRYKIQHPILTLTNKETDAKVLSNQDEFQTKKSSKSQIKLNNLSLSTNDSLNSENFVSDIPQSSFTNNSEHYSNKLSLKTHDCDKNIDVIKNSTSNHNLNSFQSLKNDKNTSIIKNSNNIHNQNSSQSKILFLKPLTDGSYTMVEHAPKINSHVFNNTKIEDHIKHHSLPILRLKVHPITNDVEFNNSNQIEIDTPVTTNTSKNSIIEPIKSSSSSQIETNSNRFVIKKNDSNFVLLEFDDYFEMYDYLPSGISWGEKHSKNKSWTESWLEQKTKSIDKNEINKEKRFGKKTGCDINNHQNWSEIWSIQGPITKVERKILKYDENHKYIIEEWNEEHFHDSSEGIIKIDKYGHDKSLNPPRYWKTSDYIVNSKKNENQNLCEKSFEEQQAGIHRGKFTRTEKDIVIYEKIWFDNTNELGEKWKHENFSCLEGNRWGRKSGINTKGQKWYEKWFKNISGDYEVDKWKEEKSINSESKDSSGEKKGYCVEKDQDYHEIWKHSESDVHKIRTDKRRWAEKSSNKKWGEIIETHEKFIKSNSIPKLSEKEEYVKKWDENNYENFDFEQTTNTYYSSDYIQSTPQEIKKFTKGNKHGYHIPTSKEWNDAWTEHFECDESKENLGTESFNEHPILKLKIKSYDKWWKQHDSNCWGEKCMENYMNGELKEEKWHYNLSDWQVDKWEKGSDGIWKGEKHGGKKDGTMWKEQWNRDENSEQKWIRKDWTEKQGDNTHQWGESSYNNSSVFTNTKWSETNNENDKTGHFWQEKVDDDGFGNIMTEKTGSSWRDKKNITNWYYDSFGESIGKKEKWAFKKGYEEKGSEWLEKWNEFPSHKSAYKTGKNNDGDEWSESWKESIDNDKIVHKWAEKQGKNNRGDEWYETWVEENKNSKTAFKKALNAKGEMWEESWGEKFFPNGSGQKWTSKWAKDSNGNYHGNSWGDFWNSESNSGHHWGEEWNNDDVKKWWHDTSINPL